ncbi:hypothetical protein [Streptomyces sp. NPDC000994]
MPTEQELDNSCRYGEEGPTPSQREMTSATGRHTFDRTLLQPTEPVALRLSGHASASSSRPS